MKPTTTTITESTTKRIPTTTPALTNPCEPNPCPKDAKGQPVACRVKAADGKHECVKPDDMCMVGDELLARAERRVIDCKNCICLNPGANFAFCESTCKPWTPDMVPPGCHLITPPGKCCQELDCSGSVAAIAVSTSTTPTTPSMDASTIAPLNPCEPNPCPKDAKGQPVACQVKPADGKHECLKPDDMCMVDNELLARAERRVIGCKNCICLNPSANFAFCESTCKPWTPDQIPPGCQLVTPPGKCCQELDCSGAAAAP
ncbi:uncharacterized protein LOC106152527 [Lingula anatina]|uniref:Uncharacterized protein LOC106152527 n=1 Tax=Lingula anatina TaxID=7574 RepID=A0A1S3H6G8_LINAN|nr:uncharacterized protein LOC106152527 [Lingula anatina]|eukprot:XP_013381593.1 uncharacterized protein LOC106152527 [Lingula anatina]